MSQRQRPLQESGASLLAEAVGWLCTSKKLNSIKNTEKPGVPSTGSASFFVSVLHLSKYEETSFKMRQLNH